VEQLTNPAIAGRHPMDKSRQGYREHEHTADWELEVWAESLPALFEQAARGMYALAGVVIKPGRHLEHRLELQALDNESLLVSFLGALLFLSETQGLAFDRFEILLQEGNLQASVQGAQIAAISREIKAVTYHNLQILESRRGLEARIVFDV